MSTDLPRITVVTPSYNQAQFLEATLLSVLGQSYPNLEYLVMDGGSKDGSAEIIQRYAPQLAYWQSQPDGGQAAALNAAFARATGDILCWVNSDDFLLPGALLEAARRLGPEVKEPRLVYGSCLFFHDQGKRAKVVRPPSPDARRLQFSAYIIQPSSFWTRALWEKAGKLDESLTFGFDWEWFLRAYQQGKFWQSDYLFSAYRFHAAHKSGSGGGKRREEILSVAKRHGGPEVIAAYEYLNRNWAKLEKRWKLRDSLRQKRWPAPEWFARLGAPVHEGPPSKVTPAELQACAEMLHEA